MFIRKKKNKSGLVSVQVITKEKGKSKLVKTIGSSHDEVQIKLLLNKADQFIQTFGGQQVINYSDTATSLTTAFKSISSHIEIGTELLLGRIFSSIGFDSIEDPLFKKLVLARLSYPVSKLKTSDYLQQYKNTTIPVQQIYRYLDKLHSSQKERVQSISYQHTLKILGNEVRIVFYDVTTLYFEIDHEDDLRKTGFSKEGKHQNPQIVLGLLVSKNGYPLAYDIFEGNKFEGHTMLPVIDAFKQKYNLHQLVIIADSGLLSNANTQELQVKKYEFILGARIKNEPEVIKRQILSLNLQSGASALISKGDLKLIITYSDERAKKDRYNREKGLRKLEKQIKTGRLTKASINNKGYNKYLKLDGEITVTIDRVKFEKDAQWDGLKGYITNALLSKEQIIENYQHLWQIEKAFRIAKTDLKIRPIYHRLQRRIEAHICIAFVSYKVYKELERLLYEKEALISPEKAIDIARTIYQIEANTESQTPVKHILLLSKEQKYLAQLFEFIEIG
jgi:transposase